MIFHLRYIAIDEAIIAVATIQEIFHYTELIWIACGEMLILQRVSTSESPAEPEDLSERSA